MILDTLRMAVEEISRNLTRSLLTALGIMLGVGAVIAMVGLGQGATASVEEDLASMGQNLLTVRAGADSGPGQRRAARELTTRDADAIEREIAHVAAVAPESSTSATVVRGDEQTQTTIRGSTPEWIDVQAWTIAEGRAPTETETLSGAAVCVLGETVRETLFGEAAAVGARVLVGKTSCTIVGVLEAKGSSGMGTDQDDLVLMPLAGVQRRLLGETSVDSIHVGVDEAANIDQVSKDITTLMRSRRNIAATADDDFHIRDTREMAASITGVTTTMTAFLSAVAGVSLLVGGIGIMNIMLVSVTERTREIGIRMAIGAQEGDVMMQFLVEAALLSTVGGVLGVLLGIVSSYIGSGVLDVPFVVAPGIVAVAVAFSAVVGLVFGWFPARRAARMEPIDALRHN